MVSPTHSHPAPLYHPKKSRLTKLPTPNELIAFLNQFVKGQHQAKREVATAFYNHYISQSNRDHYQKQLGKHHLLLIGPTGSGKSYMIQLLAKHLGVPISHACAASLVESGYRGRPVDDVVKALLDQANGNVQLAEKGIIFLDEIDKIRREDAGGRDVSGEGVQNALLTLLEGRLCDSVDGKPIPPIDTSRILFVAAGAFTHLKPIVQKRLGTDRNAIGFSKNPNLPKLQSDNLQTEDLVEYGMIPEFLGRFSRLAILHELTVEDLVDIITDPQSNSELAKRKEFAAVHGINLSFTKNAIRAIAEQAIALKTGARALNRLIAQALCHVEYILPELAEKGFNKIVINEATVRDGLKPRRYKVTPPPNTDPDKKHPHRVDILLRRDFLAPVTKPAQEKEDAIAQNSLFRSYEFPENTSEWSDNALWDSIQRLAQGPLDFDDASDNAQRHWKDLCYLLKSQPHDIHRLAEELRLRRCSINDFYETYKASQLSPTSLDAILGFFDYLHPYENPRHSISPPPEEKPLTQCIDPLIDPDCNDLDDELIPFILNRLDLDEDLDELLHEDARENTRENTSEVAKEDSTDDFGDDFGDDLADDFGDDFGDDLADDLADDFCDDDEDGLEEPNSTPHLPF
jgi:ATP-dependent Clp protease ATP-binding subunit ClpX